MIGRGKMKKRKIIKIISIAFLLMLSTGCSIFPDGTINSSEDSIAVTNSSDKIQGNINDVISIDADIPDVNAEDKIYNIKLKYRQTDKNIADKNADNVAELVHKNIDSWQDLGEVILYKFDDGSQYNDGEHISYISKDALKRNYNLYLDKNSNVESYFLNKELDDYSLEQAIKDSTEIFSMFSDVKINEKPVYVYAIDSEYAKEYQDNYSNKMLKYDLSSNGKSEKSYNESDEYYESKGYERIEWNKEDEVYYMEYEIMLDDMALNMSNISTASQFANEHKAIIVIGKNGVKQISIQMLYSKESEEAIDDKLCSTEEAMQIIADKYKYTSMLNSQELNKISLVYVPMAPVNGTNYDDIVFTARPYWVFEGTTEKVYYKDGEERHENKHVIYMVDAISKEIHIGK